MKQECLNILLYISSFIPLYLLVILKTIIEIMNGNLTFNITNTVLLVLMIVLSIIGLFGVRYLFKKEEKDIMTIKIINYQNMTDKHFLGYFSLFVLFALTFDLSKISMSVVYIVILILIGVVYVRNRLFYINPLLNIIGFSFYEVEYLDESGKMHSTKVYYHGRLNNSEYKILCNKNGMCFLVNANT